jgi:hypothetical protein
MSKVVRQATDGDKAEPPSERGTAAPEDASTEDLGELFAEAKQVDDLLQLLSWLRRLR